MSANPLGLDATALLVWGLVAHLVADWLLQNDWMAANKARRCPRMRRTPPEPDFEPIVGESITIAKMGSTFSVCPGAWWDRHPAAYAHAGVHAVVLAPLFGWLTLPLAAAHLLIDTRVPVAWWARLVRQTPPNPEPDQVIGRIDAALPIDAGNVTRYTQVDVGMLVRVNVDQVFHVVTIAAAAILVTL